MWISPTYILITAAFVVALPFLPVLGLAAIGLSVAICSPIASLLQHCCPSLFGTPEPKYHRALGEEKSADSRL